MPADPTAPGRRAPAPGVAPGAGPGSGRPACRAEVRYLLGRLLPFLVIALATVADVLTPPQERFDRFLIAAPALAAATWSA
ncbi:serine/threonine-protein phosphatase, partial [Streptomyces hydrogenans]